MSLEEVVLALMATKGVGPSRIGKVLDRAGAVGARSGNDVMSSGILEEALSPDQLAEVSGNLDEATQLREQLRGAGAETVTRLDSTYPSRLVGILGKAAPPVLFVRGNKKLLDALGVGFCGSRKASERGLRAAADCADQLASARITVVSGGAAGVDNEAHTAALRGGGTTTIVIPEGLLKFRPRRSLADVWDDDRTLVVSEFPPNLSWKAPNAMKRNKTICGLSAAMILIEAGDRGGSIEAGRDCLRLSIPLFAAVYDGMPSFATGNRQLLERGAHPLKRSRATERAELRSVIAAVRADRPDQGKQESLI